MNSVTDIISNIVNQFVVKPNNLTPYIGSQGFVFDILGDENASLESEITDHYVEANYSIQDHIALRPPRFTLTGYIGELNDIFSNSFLSALTAVQSLGLVGDYTPTFTSQATQVYNALAGASSQAGQVLNEASNAYQLVTGANTNSTRQQSAYQYFVTEFISRTLFTVETPWSTWQDMAIESIRVLQRDDNKLVSEFSITFKQIRKVTTAVTSPNTYTFSGAVQSFMDGRASDDNSLPSLLGNTVSGQDTLDDGSAVTPDLMSIGFNLPTTESLGISL